MPLTDVTVRTAKPQARAYKLSDSGGLYILVTERGSKLWRLAYRFSDKQKSLAFGPYPEITLAGARKAGTLHADPSFRLRSFIPAQIEASGSSGNFSIRRRRDVENEGTRRPTMKKKRWLLEFALAFFGERPIAEITRDQNCACKITMC